MTAGSTDTVVVTGAAGGIGLAIVRALASRGHRVVGVDVAASIADRLAAEEGDVVGVRADLTVPADRDAVADAAGTGLAGLVNCAGITRDGLIAALDDAAVSSVINVNAVAAAHLAERLGPQIRQGGAIVNIASRAALGNVGQVNYAASKGAVIGLTRALARRLAPHVRVNAVAPGLIATDMTAAMPDRVLDKLVARIPLARMGTPAEVARIVADLLGPSTSYVTGQVVYVCGGRSI